MAATFGSKIGTANVPDGFADGDTYTPPMDRFLRMNQALIQANAISYALTAPPGGPVEGDTYLVPVGGTGAWTGKDQNIAYWTLHDLANPGGVWEFYVPKTGWLAFNQATAAFLYFNGAAWVVLPFAPGGGLPSGFNIVPGNLFSGFDSDSRNTSMFILISAGSSLQNPVPAFKLVFNAHAVSGAGPMLIGSMSIKRCLRGSAIVLGSTPVLISGSGTPSIAITGTQHELMEITSDTIALALDNAHDYYFAVYWANVLSNSLWSKPNCPASLMPYFKFINGGDNTGTSPLPIGAITFGTGAPGAFVSRVIVP